MDTKTRIRVKARAIKDHVSHYRGRYVFATTTALWMLNTYRSTREWESFLKSKDIDPLEFTCPEWYDEIKNS
jgi:hypothetical protein